MRAKELKLIITFHTTSEAIAMERVCEKEQIKGRLIPVPREISAGCGLAWCCQRELRDRVGALMAEYKLEMEGMSECYI